MSRIVVQIATVTDLPRALAALRKVDPDQSTQEVSIETLNNILRSADGWE